MSVVQTLGYSSQRPFFSSCGSGLALIREQRKVSQSLNTRQEEVSTAPQCRKRRQPRNLLPNRPFWDGHVKTAILSTKNRIAFVAELVKIWIVRPNVHRKLKLADQTCTTNECRNPPLHSVLRLTLRQRWPIRPPSPNHSPPLHVRRRIARIHAPNMCAERAAIAIRVHLAVVEI